MKRMIGIVALGLTVILGASGCARTEYIEIRPQCTAPSQPALPVISRGDLWDSLGDSDYRQLERYLNILWGYADEQAALLGELCEE